MQYKRLWKDGDLPKPFRRLQSFGFFLSILDTATHRWAASPSGFLASITIFDILVWQYPQELRAQSRPVDSPQLKWGHCVLWATWLNKHR